jgi:biopolymer transport protein ExbD
LKAFRPSILIAIACIASLGALVAAFATGFIEVKVDMATPKSVSVTDAVKLIAIQQNIYVQADGSLRVGSRPTTLKTLESDLARAFSRAHAPEDRSEQPVTIWADDGAPRASIDAAYEALIRSGWTETELSMRTRQIQ